MARSVAEAPAASPVNAPEPATPSASRASESSAMSAMDILNKRRQVQEPISEPEPTPAASVNKAAQQLDSTLTAKKKVAPKPKPSVKPKRVAKAKPKEDNSGWVIIPGQTQKIR